MSAAVKHIPSTHSEHAAEYAGVLGVGETTSLSDHPHPKQSPLVSSHWCLAVENTGLGANLQRKGLDAWALQKAGKVERVRTSHETQAECLQCWQTGQTLNQIHQAYIVEGIGKIVNVHGNRGEVTADR